MRRAFGLLLVGAACWLAAGGAASAQTVTAGVKAGAVLSSLPHAGEVIDQISKKKSVDLSAKLGLTGGGFVNFTINDRFSFQPELLFVMKGVKLDLDASAGSIKAAINYLEFPLLARYTAPVSGPLNGYVVAGPAVSVKWSTSAKMELNGDSVDLDTDPAIGSRDLGLAFGGGLERDGYLLEARYTLGLIDVPTGIYKHDNSIRNRTFAVMVGMRIP